MRMTKLVMMIPDGAINRNRSFPEGKLNENMNEWVGGCSTVNSYRIVINVYYPHHLNPLAWV